jgi:hypothetical protein
MSLWASVQGDPTFMRKVNGWLTIFWIVMIPVSVATGWVQSVAYVSALSLWALVSGHWSAWQAARVEVAQEDVGERVVDQIVEETEIDRIEISSEDMREGVVERTIAKSKVERTPRSDANRAEGDLQVPEKT